MQPAPLPAAPLPLPPLPPAFVPAADAPLHALTYYPGPWIGGRPRVWTVFAAFILALVAGLVVGTIVPVIIVLIEKHALFKSTDDLLESLRNSITQPLVLLGSGLGTQLMLLATALAAALLSPVKPFSKRLRLNRSALSPLGYLIAVVGALSVSVLFSAAVGLLAIKQSGTLKLFSEVFQNLTPLEVALTVLVVGVMPGFAEEFLFRGYIQTRLVRRWGRWIGIAIAATLFGLMHMDPLQSPFAAAFGLYLGYLAEKAGSIRPTMICHMLNNTIQVFIGRYASGAGGGEPGRQGYVVMAGIAGTVLILCVLYIRVRVHPAISFEESALPEGRGR